MAEEENQNEADLTKEEDTAKAKELAEVTPKSEGTVHDGDDANADDNDDDDDEDPIEEAVKARTEQIVRQALEAERRAEQSRRAAEADEYRKAQAEEEKKKKLNDSFVNTAKRTRDALSKLPLRDEDGNAIKLTDEVIQEFVEPWREHNGLVQQAIDGTAEARVYSNLAQAAISLIPADKHEEFAKRADGKPIAEYLKTIAELNAPTTEFVKNLQEDADVKVKAAFARGFAKGQKAPPGTPSTPQQSSINRGAKPDLTSVSGAALALSRGEIDDAKFLEILNKRRDSN